MTTGPLFPDTCACPPTGHECRPNWVTEAEWGDPVAERLATRITCH